MTSKRMRQTFGGFCSAEAGPGDDKVWGDAQEGLCWAALRVTLLKFTWGRPAEPLLAVILTLLGKPGMD